MSNGTAFLKVNKPGSEPPFLVVILRMGEYNYLAQKSTKAKPLASVSRRGNSLRISLDEAGYELKANDNKRYQLLVPLDGLGVIAKPTDKIEAAVSRDTDANGRVVLDIGVPPEMDGAKQAETAIRVPVRPGDDQVVQVMFRTPAAARRALKLIALGVEGEDRSLNDVMEEAVEYLLERYNVQFESQEEQAA